MRFSKLKPKNISDAFGTWFLVLAVVSTFIFEVKMVLPKVHSIDATVNYLHIIVGLFIVLNIISNLFWLMTVENSTVGLMLPSALRPNWRFCAACEGNSPPRSYHCHICDECILKRDHHCVFSGCCIGYKNFRYYYGLLIYVGIGGLYATVLNQYFIWEVLGGFNWVTILNHLLPFPFWVFGRITFPVMVYTFIAIVDLCGCMFGFALLYYHTRLLINNQTTYERNKGTTQYSLGHWTHNVVENLGPNWLAAILLTPLVSSPLPRNGIDFPSIKEHSLNSMKSK
ncbi:unnamed protein product [Medioppia subpectinata]|uniref:Palmitoyltransferase n=1 Tax=Medioppia subpectinata TaxID=1979941 RepID=A0A7R9L016_9ACAR|nr:unnamed protein product [Medioppia subpectinata]CAG2111871.1 unnamed protein product [Medioppia subpectinata]